MDLFPWRHRYVSEEASLLHLPSSCYGKNAHSVIEYYHLSPCKHTLENTVNTVAQSSRITLKISAQRFACKKNANNKPMNTTPSIGYLYNGWLTTRVKLSVATIRVVDTFHSFGPAWQVASPQLSMHGSNILSDGESAFGCGLRGASMSSKPPSYSRWHIL